MNIVLVFLAVAVAYCAAAPWSGNTLVERQPEEHVEFDERVIRSHYEKESTEESSEVVVDSFLHNLLEEKFKPRNLTLLGFSWSNCAAGSALTIETLVVSPDPIPLPGTLEITLDAKIETEITEISSAVLVIKKKVFGFYIEIPCVDNVGSCTYNDICGMLANVTCPQQLLDLGFTCQCPFAAKEYKVPAGTEVPIPEIPDLPSFLESGDYEVKATLNNGSTALACYDIKVSLKKE